MQHSLSFVVNGICPGLFSKVKVACGNLRCSGDWQKRTRTEDSYPSPSEAGKHFWTYQRKFPVLCHRPPALAGLHVTLQVEAFARFLDVLEPPAEYNTLAVDVMVSMSNVFSTESDRQKAFVDLLKAYNVFPGFTYEECVRTGSSIPDVGVVKGAATALAIFEFKNEVANISSEPYIQCFIHSQNVRQRQEPHVAHKLPRVYVPTGVWRRLEQRGLVC